MSNELYEKIVSQRGSLENLIAKIPGFKGYHEKNARREADRLLREHIGNELERSVTRFTQIENKILGSGAGLRHMSRTREVKSKIQAYTEKVQTANPKYSAMFVEVKIGNEELDRIYAFDEAQMRYVAQFEEVIGALGEAVSKGDDFSQELETVYNVAVEAIDAFDLRDNVILNIGGSQPE